VKYLFGIVLLGAYASVFSSSVARASDAVRPVQPTSAQPSAPADPGKADNSLDKEPAPPQPPPPLVVDATGDTIHTAGGRRITHVIVLHQAPLRLTYEGFFDHARLARTYTTSILMVEVARIERSSEEDHKRLRAAWDRQIELADRYNEEIKRSGMVMFRGEWVTRDHAASIQRAERELQTRWIEARAAQFQTEAQQAQAAADEQRRWVAASLQVGQNAAVLNLLGPPTSHQQIYLAMGIVQTEVAWNRLGLRIIVHNGYIAFIERFQPRTASSETAGGTTPALSGTAPSALAQTDKAASQ